MLSRRGTGGLTPPRAGALRNFSPNGSPTHPSSRACDVKKNTTGGYLNSKPHEKPSLHNSQRQLNQPPNPMADARTCDATNSCFYPGKNPKPQNSKTLSSSHYVTRSPPPSTLDVLDPEKLPTTPKPRTPESQRPLQDSLKDAFKHPF